jgi:hypothetical protein
MHFIIGGELREVHFPQAIKDEEWTELLKLLTLPPNARSELDEYIGFCRELRDDATRLFGDRWFNILSAVLKPEQDSKKTLDDMIAQPEFFDALAMGLDGQQNIPAKELQSIRDWLKRVSTEKQRLVEWYKEALHRLHHVRTGQQTGRSALVVLVQALNRWLIDYTGSPISTGTGTLLEFVVKVCVIAFPSLLDPDRKETVVRKPYDRAELRVKKAIGQVLKEHFANLQSEEISLQSEDISGWQHLVPDWKPATHLVIRGKGVEIHFRKDGEGGHWNVVKCENPEISEVLFPHQPFVSDEVAAQQSKTQPPEQAVFGFIAS